MGFMHRYINSSHILFKKGNGKYIAKIGDCLSIKNIGPKIIGELAISKIEMATFMPPFKKPALNYSSEVAFPNEYKKGNITINITYHQHAMTSF